MERRGTQSGPARESSTDSSSQGSISIAREKEELPLQIKPTRPCGVHTSVKTRSVQGSWPEELLTPNTIQMLAEKAKSGQPLRVIEKKGWARPQAMVNRHRGQRADMERKEKMKNA